MTDVRDIARWHVRAAERGTPGERYLLGTVNVPHADLFAQIADIANVPRPGLPLPASLLPVLATLIDGGRALGLPIKLDGTQLRLSARPVYFAFDKAWAAFGPPEYPLQQSIADAFGWYDAHGFIRRSAWMRLIGR